MFVFIAALGLLLASGYLVDPITRAARRTLGFALGNIIAAIVEGVFFVGLVGGLVILLPTGFIIFMILDKWFSSVVRRSVELEDEKILPQIARLVFVGLFLTFGFATVLFSLSPKSIISDLFPFAKFAEPIVSRILEQFSGPLGWGGILFVFALASSGPSSLFAIRFLRRVEGNHDAATKALRLMTYVGYVSLAILIVVVILSLNGQTVRDSNGGLLMFDIFEVVVVYALGLAIYFPTFALLLHIERSL